MQPDQLNFDGSCEPNPGGRFGLGYIIQFADGRAPIEGGQEIAASRANTVNTAEYQALITGLRAYAEAGGSGPCRPTRNEAYRRCSRLRQRLSTMSRRGPPCCAGRCAA